MYFIDELYELIRSRKEEMPDKSYTAELFRLGIDRILKKVLEEAGEVVIAAKSERDTGREELIYETSDLIYHLLVLLAEKGITPQEIENELIKRHK